MTQQIYKVTSSCYAGVLTDNRGGKVKGYADHFDKITLFPGRTEKAARQASTLGQPWVIVGGESGPLSRPFDLSWARDLREQCRRAGVPFFVKQLGGNPVENGKPLKLEDRHGGDWEEWPEDLRIREVLAAFRS